MADVFGPDSTRREVWCGCDDVFELCRSDVGDMTADHEQASDCEEAQYGYESYLSYARHGAVLLLPVLSC